MSYGRFQFDFTILLERCKQKSSNWLEFWDFNLNNEISAKVYKNLISKYVPQELRRTCRKKNFRFSKTFFKYFQ